MKKYVVYREVTAIYGTIVEADSEEDAYELVDDENNKNWFWKSRKKMDKG